MDIVTTLDDMVNAITSELKLLHRQRHTRQFFHGQQTVYVSQVYPKETSKINVKPLTSG